MKPLNFSHTILAAALALQLAPLAAESVPPPNFIVILGEAQGWTSASVSMDDALPDARSELARTPHLERLAASGMRFANFHAASPRCTPTRAALFTGRSPAALHMTFVGEGKGGRESGYTPAASPLVPAAFVSELPEAETTLAELLRRAGYATAHFGKWHVGRANPVRHGFDESDGATNNDGPDRVENPNPRQAFGLTERGLEFMARQAKAAKPFYLQLSHYPGRGGPDARPETYESVRKRATSDRARRLVGAAAVTEDMDATLGLVLAKLDELNLTGRTYVFYTSDHGALGRNANAPLANGKGSVWEGGLRVPLIVRGPGIPAGTCTHLAASTMDLFPTMTTLARLRDALPVAIEGGSLAAVLTAAPGAVIHRPREEYIVHVPHYDKDGQTPAATIFFGNLKLIRSFETGAVQLFDLAQDLGEHRDLAPLRALEASNLDLKLGKYLEKVKALLPTSNIRPSVK